MKHIVTKLHNYFFFLIYMFQLNGLAGNQCDTCSGIYAKHTNKIPFFKMLRHLMFLNVERRTIFHNFFVEEFTAPMVTGIGAVNSISN